MSAQSVVLNPGTRPFCLQVWNLEFGSTFVASVSQLKLRGGSIASVASALLASESSRASLGVDKDCAPEAVAKIAGFLTDVLRLASDARSRFLDLSIAVAKLAGVLLESAVDPAHERTAKDTERLHDFSEALVKAVQAFAEVNISVHETVRYDTGSRYQPYVATTYSYKSWEYIGAAAHLGALVCARSGRASRVGRLYDAVISAVAAKRARFVQGVVHSTGVVPFRLLRHLYHCRVLRVCSLIFAVPPVPPCGGSG